MIRQMHWRRSDSKCIRNNLAGNRVNFDRVVVEKKEPFQWAIKKEGVSCVDCPGNWNYASLRNQG